MILLDLHTHRRGHSSADTFLADRDASNINRLDRPPGRHRSTVCYLTGSATGTGATADAPGATTGATADATGATADATGATADATGATTGATEGTRPGGGADAAGAGAAGAVAGDDAVYSEETPDTGTRLAHRRVWIIDPLDGTSTYVADVDQSKGGTRDPIATRHQLSPFRGRRARGALGSSQCIPFIRAQLTLPWVIGR
jgi:hypothetical protein